MRILITGVNGFLGQHLHFYLTKRGHTVFGAGRGVCRLREDIGKQYQSLDLTDAVAVATVVNNIQPDIIIHTAAISKPDECETNRPHCLLHNVEATKHLLNAHAATKANEKLFIFTSTDFIFGENGPHNEDDIPSPLNFYGGSKLLAEEAVKNSGLDHAIVRPVFIYGEAWEGLRPSFLHWVKNSLEAGKHIKVVADQWRTPTFVQDICRGIRNIILRQKKGAYHLAGKDILSPFQMAVKTAQVLGLDETLIEPVTADTFPEPVKRAKRSGLHINKAIKELKYDPVSFSEGVQRSFPGR